MSDTVTALVRKKIMSSVRSRDTRPEVILRKALHKRGFRYRLHQRRLPGSPDLVFPRWHAVLFVHGCFWHRHEGCRRATTPSNNSEFWADKFRHNVERDARNIAALRHLGWRVGVVWECEILPSPPVSLLDRISRFLMTPQIRTLTQAVPASRAADVLARLTHPTESGVG